MDLDGIVQAFMNVQGGLVGYSMVRRHLRSMGINVQRERIRASISLESSAAVFWDVTQRSPKKRLRRRLVFRELIRSTAV